MLKERSVVSLRAFLFFFHSTVTIIISFLPVYFQSKGLTGTQIGWLLAIGPLAAMIAQPFWGYMSDKYKTIKRMMLICLACMLASSIVLFNVDSYFALVFIVYVYYSFMSPTGALGDSLALRTANNLRISFGSIRMWGSLGFAVTSLVSGKILSLIGVEQILLPYLFYATAAFLACLAVSDVRLKQKPVMLIDACKAGGNARFLSFLFVILFVTIPHRTNDSFLGIYLLELGANETLIGWAWFVAVLSEAFVFATSAFWFRRFHELTFILLASILYGVRWLLFSHAADPVQIILLQMLHGLTFGIFYLCAFQFVTKLVPEEFQATGQLVFISVFFGLSGIIGSSIGGIMIEKAGGTTLYEYSGYLSLLGSLGICVYRLLGGKKPGKRLAKLTAKT
ncbi:major facilitator superfamily domain-containing protein 6 [Bacillaceae bacterium]